MEQVFCIARTDLETVFSSPLPTGALPGPALETVLSLPHHFIDRKAAEQNPACKQIIPYQLFQCRERFLAYHRGTRVGEQRLSGRMSLGIGGHLNRMDSRSGRMEMSDYENGLARERAEELVCRGTITTCFIGWINDESDAVGQVHLGAVHLCRVREEDQVRLRTGGEDLHGHGWWTIDQIREQASRFEPWSRMALDLVIQEKNFFEKKSQADRKKR